MKKIASIIFLLFILKNSFSQYVVTKVVGSVKKISGENISTGSQLSDNDVLLFSTPNDMVRVIVAGKGIYVINPSPKAEKKQNSVVEILKYTMHVKSKEGYLSGRSEIVEKLPAAFEIDPGLNNKTLIETENKYLFDPRTYDLTNGNKFFIQIEQDGVKPIIRSLKTNADTLLIHADDFRTNDSDVPKKIKYSIGFFSKNKNTSQSLAEIDPYFDSSDEMKQIIKVIITQSKETDKSIVQQQCYAEIYAALGRPSDIDFKKAFGDEISK